MTVRLFDKNGWNTVKVCNRNKPSITAVKLARVIINYAVAKQTGKNSEEKVLILQRSIY
jgi:hypothetical protein